MTEQEFAELAAGHALHALSAEDEARYVDALRNHPEWQAIADDDVDAAAMLAAGSAPVAPPAHIRANLLAQIADMPQERAGVGVGVGAGAGGAGAGEPDWAAFAPAPLAEDGKSVVEQRTPRRWVRGLFALAACLVLIVGIGVGVTAITAQVNRPASVVALDDVRAAEDVNQASVQLDSGAEATAYWSETLATAVLVADGLEELDPSRTYELWFVRGETPIPAGVFSSTGDEVTALLNEPLRAGDVIAVTIEDAGGSPTGLPTTEPVIVIPTA